LAQFQQTFLYYFEKGSAAERYVEREVFEKILKAAKNLPDHSKDWNIGGNAALMANRFANEGCHPVLLGGQVGRTLSTLLNSKINLASQYEGVLRTEDEVIEEVHLILEYERGALWGNRKAPRANRFIIHSDTTNAKLEPLESFHQAVFSFRPSLLVISGLHLLEGETADFRLNRLKNVVSFIGDSSQISQDSRVHLELASVGDSSFMKELVTSLLPTVDSLGLNEQELASSYFALDSSNQLNETRESFKDPKVRTVIDVLKIIFQFAEQQRPVKSDRGLSRIHFHCLTFHLIMQRKATNWGSGKHAVAAGSLATSKQACAQQELEVNSVELPLPMKIEKGNRGGSEQIIDTSDPVLVWKEDNFDLFLSPVLVCKSPQKTVGLGDAISTVALLLLLYY